MFFKSHFSPLAGALLGLVCGCALALPCATLRASDDKASAPSSAPSFIAAPSPQSQLRPVATDEAPATPAPPPTPEATGPTLAFDANTDSSSMLPASPGEVAAASSPIPSASSSPAPSTAEDTGAAAPVSVDSTPAPSVPPGPAQDPGLAKSPILGGSEDGTNAPDPAAAQGQAAGTSNAWKSSYVNLVNLLVSRGILTKKDSHDLVMQAEQDAAATNAAKAPTTTTQVTQAAPTAPPNPEDDTMRVGYVPESVKQQMRDEIKADVLQQARDEHWAAPDTTPDWVQRYHVAADIRIRYQGEYYPSGNDDTGAFHNFNAINTGSAFDVGSASSAQNPPYFNVNRDRNRFRLRARVGAEVDVGEGFTAGLRLATGSDDSPVTENQTLGGANNAQGGNFSKYSIWLDRAFLRYELGGTTKEDFSATIGRFENPFFASSMIWSDDLGFDGLVAKGRYEVADGVRPFLTVGAFPVFNTDLNFGTYQPAKFQSEDKWLYAVQGGTDWKISQDFSFKGAAAFYDFEQIQGVVSPPVDPLFQSDAEPTDDSRPAFAQNGNTYIALRNIIPNAANGFGTTNQWQYFGLASPFRVVALTGQFDYSGFDPLHVSLLGEFVKNVAFDRNSIETNGPPQIPGPVNNLSSSGKFAGGDDGYNVRLTLGKPALQKLWDWNVNLTYRYVESDAVVDGFTDSDFGGSLAGTNLKGYIVGGNLALSSRVWASLRWESANAIAGAPYENDLIQFDINAKF